MRMGTFVTLASLAFLPMPAEAQTGAPCRGASFPPGFPPLDVWMVFFDENDVAIQRQAALVLDNVADAWRSLPLAQCPIEITGYTDTSGSADYNFALSNRRAQAVAAYLRRRGVNSEIRTLGYGETRLLVETSNGVKEPQNRRADILIVPNP
jgi:OOP family OmpA-OmpF porin